MSRANFDEALRRVLAHEGGYTNHPADPGGPTNFGITIGDYRKYVNLSATAEDVRTMKLDDAKTIYGMKYWQALRCDDLPTGIDYSVFDYGVNSGVSRAGKILRRVLGMPAETAMVTDTVVAAASRGDPQILIAAICDERMAFLKSLKTWPVFGAGWGRRVAEVRSAALIMAAASAVSVQPAPSGMSVKKTAGAGAVVVAGAAAVHHANGLSAAMLIAGAVVIAVVATGAWVWFRHKEA